MDCGTCDSGPAIVINAPQVIQVELTMTQKATEMLEDAFGDDRSHALLVGVLSGGCSGYMYDLQIVEQTDIDCQELSINGFRVLVPNASSSISVAFCVIVNSTCITSGALMTIAGPESQVPQSMITRSC